MRVITKSVFATVSAWELSAPLRPRVMSPISLSLPLQLALKLKPALWRHEQVVFPGVTALAPKRAREFLLKNVSPADGLPGTVIASPSRANPDYYYHWTRDGAIVMSTLMDLYADENDPVQREELIGCLKAYALLSLEGQRRKTMSADIRKAELDAGTPHADSNAYRHLNNGEPKYHVNGSPYTGDWGRPQDDGPALRALVLLQLARILDTRGENAFVDRHLYDASLTRHTAIKSDLEYVSHGWRFPSVDLWEEVRGRHFYTRMVQCRALRAGVEFARGRGDIFAADWYGAQAVLLERELERHWDVSAGIIRATVDGEGAERKASELDAAVILGALHGGADGAPFSVTDDRILATAERLRDTCERLYPVNGRGFPATVIGRYPEDRFDPLEDPAVSRGNGWVLATCAFAELHYRAATALATAAEIRITPLNASFFNAALRTADASLRVFPGETFVATSPKFNALIAGLAAGGDAYLKRVHIHANADGSLSEQIHRDTGHMHAAPHLTWSYAAYLSAVRAGERHRRKVAG